MAQTVWLVDMGFVVKAATDGQRFKLDYVAARRFLEQRLGRTDALLFNSIDSRLGVPDGLQKFYKAMERQGFKVVLKEMTGSAANGTHRQQGVDAAIIEQITGLAKGTNTTTIVLTSGDGHFVEAVEDAREGYGKRVILFAYDVNVSSQLRKAAAEFWTFEEHKGELARGLTA